MNFDGINDSGDLWNFANNKNIIIEDVSEVNKNPSIPEFHLYQNYPNPFNPTTTIMFSIPYLQHVSLKVYDLLGRKIVTLLNEVKSPGTYKIKFDGSDLPGGIYFYRINAGNFAETKKLILLK